jgi:hypothetical protein
MFSSSITGVAKVAAAIKARDLAIKKGVYDITLRTLTIIQKQAAIRVPKDTGLLRANIRVAINDGMTGRAKQRIDKNIKAENKSQRDQAKKLGRSDMGPTAEQDNWLADSDGKINGIAYNILPYAHRRDEEGGINRPKGFLSNTGKRVKVRYIAMIKNLVGK